MQEILKILFRTLYHLIRRFFARISESKVSVPNPKKEHYISRLADSSRKYDSKKDIFYQGIRIPHKSETRFSVLFPGVLGSYERDYFSSKSWVNYFEDDRIPTKKPEKGYIIYWTDQAVGTQDLFATCWNFIQKLPPEVCEIHADGEYLRTILKGTSELQRKTDQPKIKQTLSELSKTLQELPVNEAKRVTLNDRIPILNFLINGALLFAFIGLVFLVLPTIDYLDCEKAEDYLICGAFVIAAISIPFYWRQGFLNAIRISVLISFVATLSSLAIYQRIHYQLRTQGNIETWYVMSTKKRFAKYTKELTGYQISFFATGKRWNTIIVPMRILKEILPQEKEKVLFTTYTDILGFHYIDSAKYTPVNDQTVTIELVN
jgi:hypothetical protein